MEGRNAQAVGSESAGPRRRSISPRITEAVIEEIQRGPLAAADPLPGTRRPAEELEVNRKTVMAAYEELAAQGWVTTDRRRGTFVTDLAMVRPIVASDPTPAAFARTHGVSIGLPPPLATHGARAFRRRRP